MATWHTDADLEDAGAEVQRWMALARENFRAKFRRRAVPAASSQSRTPDLPPSPDASPDLIAVPEDDALPADVVTPEMSDTHFERLVRHAANSKSSTGKLVAGVPPQRPRTESEKRELRMLRRRERREATAAANSAEVIAFMDSSLGIAFD